MTNRETQNIQSPFLTVPEAARFLRVHIMTVYRWLNTGDLKAARIGNRWRIPKNRLELLCADVKDGD